jgi:hypothetical protein
LGQQNAFFFRVYVNQDEKVAVYTDVLVEVKWVLEYYEGWVECSSGMLATG